MKAVIGIMCFAFVIFINPAESAKEHKYEAIHPIPIQLNIHHYGTRGRRVGYILTAGIYDVGTVKENCEYIIGVIFSPMLFPLMARVAGLRNTYERVKVRIDGNHANVTVPISKEDPLNRLFFHEFGPERIRKVQVPEIDQ